MLSISPLALPSQRNARAQKSTTGKPLFNDTQVATWANRQKDGVFSLSVEGKQGSEYHNVQ